VACVATTDVQSAPVATVRSVRVGVLTGGGDCPGLNAVIRAVVRKGEFVYGDELFGFLDSWDGVMEQRSIELSVRTMRGMLPKGGTILGTRRGSPFDHRDGVELVRKTFADYGLDAFIVIGGDGSLTVTKLLWEQTGLPFVGVPKTIDNDISSTEVTFGFHTAVQVATEAIDRLHTTAEAHDRVMVVEVMGRYAGWIATYAGIAGGATAVLIPEHPFDLDEVCGWLRKRHERGRYASIVVVAEGARPVEGTMEMPDVIVDRYGHRRMPGIASLIAPEIEHRTGFDTRVVILGHVQRGGTPTAFDRVLSTRYGLAAIDAAHRDQFGQMVAMQNDVIGIVPLADAVGKMKPVPHELYQDVCEVFFG
jgi:ATP-dependent phosphofructokinase / diphosphate-dependent phosphofructokinase